MPTLYSVSLLSVGHPVPPVQSHGAENPRSFHWLLLFYVQWEGTQPLHMGGLVLHHLFWELGAVQPPLLASAIY